MILALSVRVATHEAPPTKFAVMRQNRRRMAINRMKSEAVEAGWDEVGDPYMAAAHEPRTAIPARFRRPVRHVPWWVAFVGWITWKNP